MHEVRQGLDPVAAYESCPDTWTFSKECSVFCFTVFWTDGLTLGKDGWQLRWTSKSEVPIVLRWWPELGFSMEPRSL